MFDTFFAPFSPSHKVPKNAHCVIRCKFNAVFPPARARTYSTLLLPSRHSIEGGDVRPDKTMGKQGGGALKQSEQQVWLQGTYRAEEVESGGQPRTNTPNRTCSHLQQSPKAFSIENC